MKNWWKKYQLVVIAFFVTMTLGISCVIAYIVWNPSRIQTRVYENDYYTFHYDTTWKVQEEQEYQTVLSHDESSVSLQYLPLEETDYTTLENLKGTLLYEFSKQNEGYELIAEEDITISKRQYPGYQVLYESAENQILFIFTKIDEGIVMWSYQAPHQQFDILLDSFEYMLEDFSLVHPQQEQQNYQYPMELSSIGWNQDKDLNNQFLKTKKGELASVNYRIEYEIPDVLELTRFESNVSHYRYRYEHEDTVLNFEVSFMTSLYPIYTVLDDMYADSQFKRQNSQMYQNYQTTLEKVEDSAYPLYIFRETYTFSSSESYINPFETEEVTMLFEIAKNCTLRITIDSDSVPAELVNHIRVTSAKEVGFYTNTEMRGDNLYSNLKRIVNQSEHLAEQWTIQLPNHWLEITNYLYSTDIFGSRSYYMDYTYEFLSSYYKYMLDYQLDNVYTDAEQIITSHIDILNKTIKDYNSRYGTYQLLTFSKKKKMNGREYYIYKGFYHDGKNRVIEKVMLYTFSEFTLMKISLEATDSSITDDMIQEVANVSSSTYPYE